MWPYAMLCYAMCYDMLCYAMPGPSARSASSKRLVPRDIVTRVPCLYSNSVRVAPGLPRATAPVTTYYATLRYVPRLLLCYVPCRGSTASWQGCSCSTHLA